MKKVYILIFSLLFAFPSLFYAQDLIVTNNGDSLNCKITEMKNEEVYFTYKHNGELISTWLRLDRVKHCQFNFFENAEVPVGKILAKKIYPRFRVALHGGAGYQTARLHSNLSDDLKSYMKKLKFGGNYGLDFSYYFSEYFGIGVGYNGFSAKNEIENRVVFTPDTNGGYYANFGKLSDNIQMNFIGAFVHSRILSVNKKNIFSCGMGVGYLGYNNKMTKNLENFTIHGGTVGICWNVNYDIIVYKTLAAGFQISYVFGFLPQARVSNGYDTQIVNFDENISRIDVSIGLRFISNYSRFQKTVKQQYGL